MAEQARAIDRSAADGCTQPVASTARSVGEIVVELRSGRFADIAERSRRAQDAADGGGLETLRKDGYM
jgi:sulfate adenylyltransferase subunit 2